MRNYSNIGLLDIILGSLWLFVTFGALLMLLFYQGPLKSSSNGGTSYFFIFVSALMIYSGYLLLSLIKRKKGAIFYIAWADIILGSHSFLTLFLTAILEFFGEVQPVSEITFSLSLGVMITLTMINALLLTATGFLLRKSKNI